MNSGSILEYDGSTGDYLGVFSDGMDMPQGMAYGPNGNLFVGSYTSKSILEYDAINGDLIGTFVTGSGLDYPAGFVFVPEPTSITLLAVGALTLLRRRKR